MQEEIIGIDFAVETAIEREYERTKFVNCSFSGADLQNVIFEDCQFFGCSFVNTSVGRRTALRKVSFTDCKLVSLMFDECNPFGLEISFGKCILSYCHFTGMNLSSALFAECIFTECNFSDANLQNVSFSNCSLPGTIFSFTNLECANFSSAHDFSFLPSENKIAGAKFSIEGAAGLLKAFGAVVE